MAKRRVLPVFVPHLGCQQDCVFCNQRKIAGAVKPAAAETVAAEIQQASAFLRGRPAELAFYGGSFTAIPEDEQEALLRAAAPFLALHEDNSIRVSTRPDCVTPEALDRLRRYGVGTVELGIQSMDSRVLALSGRGYDLACCQPAVALLHSWGFQVILQMMTGLPGDTPEGSVETARQIIAMAPHGVRIYPTVVVRDTPLCQMYRAGLYQPHTVEDAVALCARLVPLFHGAGIPIIRMGLNPTEDLSGGEAVAGAYHPALGELVYSRVYYLGALEICREHRGARRLELGVHSRDISQMTGQRRANILALEREFNIGQIKVRGMDVPRFTVLPLDAEKT